VVFARILIGALVLGLTPVMDARAVAIKHKSLQRRSKAVNAKNIQTKNTISTQRAEADYKQHELEMRHRQYQQMQQSQQRGYQMQRQQQSQGPHQ